jgi:molecular chaperone GrpE
MQAKEETPRPDEDVREDDVVEDVRDEIAEASDEAAAEPSDEAAAEPVDVEALQAEAARAAELEERLKRTEAEFVNETKRIRRNAAEERKYAIERVVVDLLPVVDALQGAREALGEGEAADRMREGLDLVDKQLASTFEIHGVTRIEALGQPFDPGRHQAMMMIERPDLEPQTVCEVLRQGYELKGRVVRPAEVVVVKSPPAAEAPDETPPSSETSEDVGEEA